MKFNDENEAPEYEVGYKRPPKHTQFKRGRSGNPKGRPKGKRNWKTVFHDAMWEQVPVNRNGQRENIPKIEAAFTQFANRAASGDVTVLKHLPSLLTMAEQTEADAHTADPLTTEVDEKLIQKLSIRLGALSKSTEDDGNGEA
jgi:hypothetical protein